MYRLNLLQFAIISASISKRENRKCIVYTKNKKFVNSKLNTGENYNDAPESWVSFCSRSKTATFTSKSFSTIASDCRQSKQTTEQSSVIMINCNLFVISSVLSQFSSGDNIRWVLRIRKILHLRPLLFTVLEGNILLHPNSLYACPLPAHNSSRNRPESWKA